MNLWHLVAAFTAAELMLMFAFDGEGSAKWIVRLVSLATWVLFIAAVVTSLRDC